MGMDVYGKKPTSEVGAYFRAMIWQWEPLAELVQIIGGDLAAKCAYWYTNDEDGLGAADSRKLAGMIETALKTGEVASYLEERKAHLTAFPDEGFAHALDTEIVRAFAAFLAACGGFEIR